MAARADTSKTAESSDKVSVICRALRRAIIEQALEPAQNCPRTRWANASASAAPSRGMRSGNLRPKAWSSCAATASP